MVAIADANAANLVSNLLIAKIELEYPQEIITGQLGIPDIVFFFFLLRRSMSHPYNIVP